MDEFSYAPAFRLRVLGLLLVAMALVLLVVCGAALLLAWSGTAVAVVGLAVVLLALAAGALLARPRWVVRLDAGGYAVRGFRAAGVRRARWAEVEDVQAVTLRGLPCLVLRLRDGRSTTVPAGVLAGGPDALAHAVRDRLQSRRR